MQGGNILVAGTHGSDFAVARLLGSNGSLDTDFGEGTNGYRIVPTPVGNENHVAAVAIDGSGQIYVGGTAGDDFAVHRFDNTGDVDTNFGTDGLATADFGDAADRLLGLTIESTGVVLAGGSEENLALARFDLDGEVDSNFGTNGQITTPFVPGVAPGTLAVDPNGAFLLAGSQLGEANVARYGINGTSDVGFGELGYVTTRFWEGPELAAATAELPDGRILVGNSHGNDFVLTCYDPDGTRDWQFGSNGAISIDFGHTVDAVADLVVHDGDVLIAGTSNGDLVVARLKFDTSDNTWKEDETFTRTTVDFGHQVLASGIAVTSTDQIVVVGTSNNDFAVARLNANGGLDTTFDNDDGKATYDLGASTVDSAAAVLIQPDDKILVVGTTDDNFAVLRLGDTLAADRDSTFGTNGLDTFDISQSGSADRALDATLCSSGSEIIVAGISNGQFAVAKYNLDPAGLETSFGTNGRTMLGSASDAMQLAGVAILDDGTIVVAGHDDTSGDFALGRCLSDGEADTGLGTGGVVTLGDDSFVASGAAGILVDSEEGIILVGSQRDDVASAHDLALARVFQRPDNVVLNGLQITPADTTGPKVINATLSGEETTTGKYQGLDDPHGRHV